MPLVASPQGRIKSGKLWLTETQSETRARPKRKAKDFGRLWSICNEAGGRLDLYEAIGYGGVSAKEFVGQLDSLGDVDLIDLFINSDGGDCFDALAIYASLQRHDARINVHIDGIAASAASFIAMAADSISIAASARLMIHNASTIAIGDANELKKVADILQSLNSTIANIYAKRSGGRQQTFLDLMAQETWFTAEQSIKAGLADSIFDLKGKSPGNVAARLRRLDADDRRYGKHNKRNHPPSDVAARIRQLDRDAIAFN